MNQPENLDLIDALLREQNPHIDDNGFTTRVVSALPPRQRDWLRPAFLLGAVTIGSGLVMRWLPWKKLILPDVTSLVSLDFQALLPWVLVLAVIVSLGLAVAAALPLEE